MAGERGAVGPLVRRARRRLGWSQLRLAAELGRSESWVTKLETGRLGLDRVRTARKLADLLGLDPGVLLGLATPDEGGIAVDVAAVSGEVLRVRLTPTARIDQDGGVHRRGFIEVSTRLAGGLLAWQVLDADRIQRLLRVLERPGLLDDATIDAATAAAAAWQRSYWTTPAATLLPRLEGQLAIVQHLRAEAGSDAHRGRLALVEADLARLAGLVHAQDRQDRAAAAGCYARAVELAAGAGDDAMAAWAFGGISFLHAGSGDPRVALRYAERAAAMAARAQVPSLASWVALVAAHAHAGLGQAAACQAALGRAEDLFAKGPRDREPPWMGFLTERFVRSDEGSCLVRLGRGRDAVAVLDQALAGLPAGALKLRGVILANRAAALGQAGELDAACHDATQALELASQVGYERVAGRVRAFHAALDPSRQAAPAARALREQLAML